MTPSLLRSAMVIETIERTTEPDIHEKIQTSIREFFAGFNCQKCGKCCREGVGVALWGHEVKRLTRLEPHLLRHTFTRNGWTLLKMPCVFYHARKKKCKIYNARPIACKLYPLGVETSGNIRKSSACSALNE